MTMSTDNSMGLEQTFLDIKEKLAAPPAHRDEAALSPPDLEALRLQRELEKLPSEDVLRLQQEFNGMGPIENLLQDSGITEILLNGPESIWFEKLGQLHFHPDRFYSPA